MQETGVPAGFPRPLVFAMVDVGGFRIFAPLVDIADLARVELGMGVAGLEVVYSGLKRTPEEIVAEAVQEDVGG